MLNRKVRTGCAWAVQMVLGGLGACEPATSTESAVAASFLTYTADPGCQTVALYWQDEAGQPLRSLGRLRDWLQQRGQELEFACNGGMFHAGNVPVGLFIENGQVRTPLDTSRGRGNFYLRPNGVFYLTRQRRAGVCPTDSFARVRQVQYATQSGPMLITNGHMHPAFQQRSGNRHIRNGVGVLPDGRVVWVMSRQKVTFYELAQQFRQLGCRNALYLDGYVSRTYLPAQNWRQTDGDFGVMIGVTE
ncbi:phosphodiester glycosidase family protein [Hymenobacter endophyticus]|uniref:Phosphodiester glycosidase family protein n=1 Tax=Hymenobacter endophyticus TaxID=3076335 RepID=A0ABU3TMA3_9BACT|nr:phosphodiester glycosidase family protein [Hymenobacter endophyticus]MDU0372485.1 phosphodiester glycosidase family protein [Hymenobacter endophyticus]